MHHVYSDWTINASAHWRYNYENYALSLIFFSYSVDVNFLTTQIRLSVRPTLASEQVRSRKRANSHARSEKRDESRIFASAAHYCTGRVVQEPRQQWLAQRRREEKRRKEKEQL